MLLPDSCCFALAQPNSSCSLLLNHACCAAVPNAAPPVQHAILLAKTAGCAATGLDISPSMLAYAAQQAQAAGAAGSLSLVEADMSKGGVWSCRGCCKGLQSLSQLNPGDCMAAGTVVYLLLCPYLHTLT